MNKIISALHDHATFIAQHRAIEDENSVLTYRQLLTTVERVAAQLKLHSPQVISIFAENGIAHVVADLAAMSLGVPVVALPTNLSRPHLLDILRKTHADCLLTDRPDGVAKRGVIFANASELTASELVLVEFFVDTQTPATLPFGTAKVGVEARNTCEPKNVCIGHAELESAAESMLGVAASMQGDRHFCLSPLTTSHENVGGVYTTILAGATICIAQPGTMGIAGESVHVEQLAASLDAWCATSVLTTPALLRLLVAAARRGVSVPCTIRYVSVAGSFLPALLTAADHEGIPVYEPAPSSSKTRSSASIERCRGAIESAANDYHVVPSRLATMRNALSELIAVGDCSNADVYGIVHQHPAAIEMSRSA